MATVHLAHDVKHGRQVAIKVLRPALAVTGREKLFEGPYTTDPFHPNYDVAPDGKSFVMLQPVEGSRHLVMVHNWIQDLRRRTAGGK